jgi:hypothetical protein
VTPADAEYESTGWPSKWELPIGPKWCLVATASRQAAGRPACSAACALVGAAASGAFRIVVAKIGTDRAIAPPVSGRDVLKGRAEVRERAIALASERLSSRAVAAAVNEPMTTVDTWLRDAGVVTRGPSGWAA